MGYRHGIKWTDELIEEEIVYAIYKGDDFVYMGTKKECAEHLGVKPETVKFYTTPTYRKRSKTYDNNRTVVIRVED